MTEKKRSSPEVVSVIVFENAFIFHVKFYVQRLMWTILNSNFY